MRFGEWSSPISAADLAVGGRSLTFPGLVPVDGSLEAWWLEERAEEAGRGVVMRRTSDGTLVEATPASHNVRTRIHEYGGRPWTAFGSPVAVVYCNWDDQRLYRADSEDARPLTPAITETVEHRYAEPVVVDDSVIVVRETHEGGAVFRAIVRVPLDGSAADDPSRVQVIADGHQFFASPTMSPDGRRLAYLAWDHPAMPWDWTLLCVREDGGPERVVMGGGSESVMQPEWLDDDTISVVTDRTGFYNLHAVRLDCDVTAITAWNDESFFPLWLLGMTSYAVLADGLIAVSHGLGEAHLSVVDWRTGEVRREIADVGVEPFVAGRGHEVIAIGARAMEADGVLRIDARSGDVEVVRRSREQVPDARYLPAAESRTFRGPEGRDIHAFVYPPRNLDVTAPEGERPPYLVFVHGGPTAHVSPVFDLTKAFFTSRGIGVVDVNYGGSSGYGREYRERLRGQWGIVDVEDCAAVARALVDEGLAAPGQVAIRGGSAGGWTTLACLVMTDAFGAGAAYFPVTDLLPFATETHDFESRYLDGLVGPLPESEDLYRSRSPLTHAESLRTPVIQLQGADDRVVPPSQPQAFDDALRGTGIPHKLVIFEGEQHGFRMAESIVAAHEAELSFYGQVFGFTPVGIPVIPLDS